MTFVTYVYSSDDHILTAERAFVCLTLFDIIKMPLAMLPLLIVYMLEVNETAKSIIRFRCGSGFFIVFSVVHFSSLVLSFPDELNFKMFRRIPNLFFLK